MAISNIESELVKEAVVFVFLGIQGGSKIFVWAKFSQERWRRDSRSLRLFHWFCVVVLFFQCEGVLLIKDSFARQEQVEG